MLQSWIREENVGAFLSMVAVVAGYELDSDEVEGLLVELCATNEEAGNWLAYEMSGTESVNLELALDEASPIVVHVRVEVGPRLDREISTVVDMAGSFRIRELADA